MKSNTQIDVVISTLNEGVERVHNIFRGHRDDVRYLIVHQVDGELSSDSQLAVEKLKLRGDVNYFSMLDRGLSRSRNFGIEKSKGDLCWLLDDDVGIDEEAFDLIIATFLGAPLVIAYTYMMATPDGRVFKKYAKTSRPHNIFSINKVSSVEVVLNRRLFQKLGCNFDERLGLGADIPLGEENALMKSIIAKKGRVVFYPNVIVHHPEETTGRDFNSSMAFNKGAQFSIVYGKVALLLCLLFSIKKWKMYRSKISFLTFSFYIYKGCFKYLTQEDV
ncbi:MAG: glycosyltransferase [Colwellia sp.]|jgi:Glycosyl transferase family 2.